VRLNGVIFNDVRARSVAPNVANLPELLQKT
jgi:hypothetical protein